jgi:hypothetical protein
MNLNLNLNYKGPQALPACPSGKGSLSVDKTFGSREGKMKSGARREVGLGQKSKLV